MGFHASQYNVSPFPGTGGEQVRKLARDGVRNRYAVDPELEIRVILPDVYLFEAAVDCAGDRCQDVMQVQIVTPWQGFDVFPADGIGFTGRVGLDGDEGCYDFQGNILGFRQSQHDWIGSFLADRNHHALASIGVLNGLDGKDAVVRGHQRKLACVGCCFRRDQGSFLIP